MALTQEQFDKLHSVSIEDIEDVTSRFSFKVLCSCGYQGLLYTQEQSEALKQLHLDRRRLAPY